MAITCINCGEAELKKQKIQLTGKVRGKEYTVAMQGSKCDHCGYQTIAGRDMEEFGRLLADEYRRAHGLLTSAQIKARRKAARMSQEDFADYLGVGIASLKRWEMGKIQNAAHDHLIRAKTVSNITMPAWDPAAFVGAASTIYIQQNAGIFITCFATDADLPANTDCILQDFASRNVMTENYQIAAKATLLPAHLASFLNERELNKNG
jgi:putative zinc finger/helix-turn-helix YgiT family protein